MRETVSRPRESKETRKRATRRRGAALTRGRGACRLAALGDSRRAAEWISLFARPGDLIHVEGACGLGARRGEYGLVLTGPRPSVPAGAHSGPASVPMRVRRPSRRNPHARLLLAPLPPPPEVSDATSPLFALAADGSVCGANRRFVEAMGCTLREVIGSNVSTLLGQVSPGWSDPIAQSLADGRARTRHVEYERLSRFRQVTIRPLSRTRSGVGALLVRLEGAA